MFSQQFDRGGPCTLQPFATQSSIERGVIRDSARLSPHPRAVRPRPAWKAAQSNPARPRRGFVLLPRQADESLDTMTSPTQQTCPSCAAPAEDGTVVCAKCGTILTDTIETPEVVELL